MLSVRGAEQDAHLRPALRGDFRTDVFSTELFFCESLRVKVREYDATRQRLTSEPGALSELIKKDRPTVDCTPSQAYYHSR
jgi:hypothetical protein